MADTNWRQIFRIIVIIIRLIIAGIVGYMYLIVCPLIIGDITLECVVYIIIIVILLSDTASDAGDLIPSPGEKSPSGAPKPPDE